MVFLKMDLFEDTMDKKEYIRITIQQDPAPRIRFRSSNRSDEYKERKRRLDWLAKFERDKKIHLPPREITYWKTAETDFFLNLDEMFIK